MKPLAFWFEFASTYSYPAAMRVEQACRDAGVTLQWRPFLLGPIFKSMGMADSPFNLNPIKGRYMWRDMERLCAAQSLPYQKPSAFPRGSLLAMRVVVAHEGSPWIGDFIRAVYTANFAEDRDIGDDSVIRDVIRDVLGTLGQSPEAVCAAAVSDQTKARLRKQTEEAAQMGLFGAPSMVVDGDIFWGGDRLEAAIEAAQSV